MKYQNIIFDLYGTLADIRTDEESPDKWEKIVQCFRNAGAVYTEDELRNAFSLSVENQKLLKEEIDITETFRELFLTKGIGPSRELIQETASRFRKITTEYLCLYPGVKQFLKELGKQRRRLYLLTNAQRIFTVPELKQLDIYDFFDGIFISSDYGVKKPNPAFFQILLKECALSAEKCLMIGNDMTCDIKGALAAGMEACYLHTNLSPADDENDRPEREIPECGSIREVSEKIRELEHK